MEVLHTAFVHQTVSMIVVYVTLEVWNPPSLESALLSERERSVTKYLVKSANSISTAHVCGNFVEAKSWFYYSSGWTWLLAEDGINFTESVKMAPVIAHKLFLHLSHLHLLAKTQAWVSADRLRGLRLWSDTSDIGHAQILNWTLPFRWDTTKYIDCFLDSHYNGDPIIQILYTDLA